MTTVLIHFCEGCGEEFKSLRQSDLFCSACAVAPIHIRREKSVIKYLGNERNYESKIREKLKRHKRRPERYFELK